jgi:hypothetical protein
MALSIAARVLTLGLLTVVGATHARADGNFTAGTPVLDVRAPALLAGLESRGLAFAALLGSPNVATLRDLYQDNRPFKIMADRIGSDVEALRRDMKANGRTLYEVTDQNVGRVIDLRWLQSPLASFRLAGVVNRIDPRILPRCAVRQAAARCASSIGCPIASSAAP